MNRLSRTLTVIAVALGALLAGACTEEIAGPGPEVAQASVNDSGHAVTRCTPQPSDFSSARIGPSGGTLKAGGHMLRIPAGALKRPVMITMAAPSDSLNYVVFGPEGLTFDPASLPVLVMSYRNCPVTQSGQSSLEVVYTDDALTAVLDSTETVSADTLNRTLGVRLKHFSKYVLMSRYAIAY